MLNCLTDIGNLNPESKASDLRKKFETFGTVTECDIVNNYGFVHMETEAEADAALGGLQDVIIDGVKINVERSHGKRGGGPGPMRRRFRDGPPEPFRGPPRGFMGGGPSRMGRYGPGWGRPDDRFGGPYGPPPPRGGPGYPEYPMNGSGRYPAPERSEPTRSPPRGPGRDHAPPPPQAASGPGFRGPPIPDAIPPSRDYPSKNGPPRSGRYDSYDGYGEYDRYRETPARPNSRPNNYYDNYGKYNRGWKQAHHLASAFWKRWSDEYMRALLRRQRWINRERNFREDDVVLVVCDHMPKDQWPLGMIQSVETSADGLVRTVIVKSKGKCIRRDIRKLCLLEEGAGVPTSYSPQVGGGPSGLPTQGGPL